MGVFGKRTCKFLFISKKLLRIVSGSENWGLNLSVSTE